jgi:uncharacterized protein YbjT (DUF2867 family)
MKLVITGSLGNISKPLAIALVQKGHIVTVISSNAERQKDIEAIGAVAAIGSLTDVDFLKLTFENADALYCMIPPNYAATDPMAYYRSIGNAYKSAIENLSVKRLVHLSSWGAHLTQGSGMILGSHYVENILNELSDVNITHIRPTSFYTNMYAFTNMIKHAGMIGSNYGGDDKVAMVHATDIAETAAEELQKVNPENKIRYVASDEMTCNEAAKIIGATIGKPDLQWLTFTNEQTSEGLSQNGVPAYLIPYIVDLGASIHSGALGEEYWKSQTKLGKVKMEDFVKEFAAVYNQG